MILTSIYVNAWQEPVGELRVIQEEADGREIEVTVFGADGQPIDFTGKTVSVYLEKPDGTMVYNACAVSGTTATITLTLQMMAVAGCSKLFELQIIDSDSHTLKVPLPPLHIVPSNYDGAIESTDEFTALTQALAQIGQATEDANTATGAANAAASAATTAAGSANTAAQTANTAAGNADDAADAANTAASAANSAKDAANNAASAANTAAGLANTAAGAANTAAGAANSAAQAANEAAEEASTTAATTATNVINQQKGTANGVATLGANGKLVQMPTASDVGALDESIIQSGTWTPVIYGGTTAGSCTYTQQWGEYYKIGKMCYVSFRIGFNSPAGMSGTLGIKGFPFPVGIAPDSGAARGPTLAYSRINVDGAVLYLHLYKNASNAQLMRAYSGSFDSVDSSTLSSTGAMYLYASFVYVTT